MRKIFVATSVTLALAMLAWAGDVWKTKPYAQWDEKDVMAVLQTSPWAKVNVTTSGGAWRPSDSTAITGGAIGQPGSSSDTSHVSAGATPDKPSGSEKAAAATGPSIYNIYWWSARTIREASMRRQVLKGAITQDVADTTVAKVRADYEILVAGQNMDIFQQRGEQAFKDAAFIEMKKEKKKLSPTNVEFQKTSDGKVLAAIFTFPKKDGSGESTITPDEKEIDFNLRIGDAWVRTNFSLKQMVDSQGEDL